MEDDIGYYRYEVERGSPNGSSKVHRLVSTRLALEGNVRDRDRLVELMQQGHM